MDSDNALLIAGFCILIGLIILGAFLLCFRFYKVFWPPEEVHSKTPPNSTATSISVNPSEEEEEEDVELGSMPVPEQTHLIPESTQ